MEAARRAAEADLPALVGLWQAAVAAATPARGGPALLGELAGAHAPEVLLRSGLHAPDQVLVAGCIDEVVVGITTARLHRPPSAPERPVSVVEVLFVEPEARGVGVGEAMMDVVIGWGERVGCYGIEAPALPGARDAKAFFETMGLVTRVLVMHRPITPYGRSDPPPRP